MTKLAIEYTGLDEAIAAATQSEPGIRAELVDDLQIATFPIFYALADYPDQVEGSDYVRTYHYRESITSDVQVSGSDVEYTATQAADYSIYLRGDGDNYPGAYMHVGRWRSLKNIMDSLIPVAVYKMQDRLTAFMQSLWK